MDSVGLKPDLHHWFAQGAKQKVETLCCGIINNVNHFTTPVAGPSTQKSPPTQHYWLTHGLKWTAVVNHHAANSQDCCEFVSTMVPLILNIWNLMWKLSGVTQVPEFTTQHYLTNADTTIDFFELIKKACKGKKRRKMRPNFRIESLPWWVNYDPKYDTVVDIGIGIVIAGTVIVLWPAVAGAAGAGGAAGGVGAGGSGSAIAGSIGTSSAAASGSALPIAAGVGGVIVVSSSQ